MRRRKGKSKRKRRERAKNKLRIGREKGTEMTRNEEKKSEKQAIKGEKRQTMEE